MIILRIIRVKCERRLIARDKTHNLHDFKLFTVLTACFGGKHFGFFLFRTIFVPFFFFVRLQKAREMSSKKAKVVGGGWGTSERNGFRGGNIGGTRSRIYELVHTFPSNNMSEEFCIHTSKQILFERKSYFIFRVCVSFFRQCNLSCHQFGVFLSLLYAIIEKYGGKLSETLFCMCLERSCYSKNAWSIEILALQFFEWRQIRSWSPQFMV